MDAVLVDGLVVFFALVFYAFLFVVYVLRGRELSRLEWKLRIAFDDIRDGVWHYYKKLKAYKQSPDPDKIISLERQFDDIFTQTTEFETINKALCLIHKDKKELLLVLKRPEIPLHNNISENSIRIYVTKRKVHGGTRSEKGRCCRDTFMSLKKTCRKLGISFREYLFDRLSGSDKIPPLHMLLTQKYFGGT